MSRGHLTQAERYQVHALREAGLSLRAIGKRMHRSASTICRELKRNRCPAGYSPDPAHTRARQRRRQASNRPRIDPSHWPRIEALLREDHSPEQIAGATGLASHERIYQHIAAVIGVAARCIPCCGRASHAGGAAVVRTVAVRSSTGATSASDHRWWRSAAASVTGSWTPWSRPTEARCW